MYTDVYICIYVYRKNGKRKFVFLGRQTINRNRRLLFPKTCQSMIVTLPSITVL